MKHFAPATGGVTFRFLYRSKHYLNIAEFNESFVFFNAYTDVPVKCIKLLNAHYMQRAFYFYTDKNLPNK